MVLVLVMIAMVGLLAMAGLALDSGHLMLNKARLQNAVDASALAAAKVVDESRDTVLAQMAAIDVFTDNADGAGNNEVKEAYERGDINLRVQFSNSLNPFVSGSYDPAAVPPQSAYVRVRASNFRMGSWLIQAVGIADKTTAASAVAGPSPSLVDDAFVCDLAPLMLCGNPPTGEPPPEGEDPYGFVIGETLVLKLSAEQDPYCQGSQEISPDECPVAPDHPNFRDCECTEEVGPGNFHAIRLDGESGAAAYRDHLAGDASGCFDMSDNPEIETEPGNMVGPTQDGLNTRFGAHCGPMSGTDQTYKEDTNTCSDPYDFTQYPAPYEADYTYADYRDNQFCDAGPAGDQGLPNTGHPASAGQDPDYFEPMRRVIQVPVGDCSAKSKKGGHLTMPLVGVACAFLLQPMPGKGPDCKKPKPPQGGNQSGQRSIIFAEIIEECSSGAAGYGGDTPGAGPGPYIIQLYKDPDSIDS